MPMTRCISRQPLAALSLLSLLAFAPSPALAADPVWSQLPPPAASSNPLPRHGHTAVLDPVAHRMIVFGGFVSGLYGGPLGDVQTLSLEPDAAWASPAIPPGPPSRYGHSALYDPIRARMLVFGGAESATTAFGDLWSLSLGATPQWEELAPLGTGPSPRFGQSAIYDPLRDRVIVFGGYDPASGFQNDVWELALSGAPAWTQLSPSGPAPSVRDYHAAVYDPVGDRMIVFGGNDNVTSFGDVWALSLGTSPAWTQLVIPGSAPAGRLAPAYAYDSDMGRLLCFGGYGYGPGNLGDVWALDLGASPAWTQLNPIGPGLNARYSASMVFDPPAHRVMVFGGYTSGSSSNLRQLSLGSPPTWALFTPPSTLPGLYGHTVTLDPARARLVLCGGAPLYSGVGRLWTFALSPRGTRWVPAAAPIALPWRYGHSAILDPARDRLVVFGGYDGSYLNEVWTLSLSTLIWQTLVPAGTPPGPRDYHDAVYDPVRDRMLVFGGNYEGATLNDLWELTLSGTPTWTQLAPGGPTPPSRLAHHMVYDPGHDRVLMFGGWNTLTHHLGDTWRLALSPSLEWSQLSPAISPSPRYSHSMVLDPSHDRILMFGGEDGPSLNDLWALSLGSSPAWSELATIGGPPQGRHGHAAAFDLASDAMIVEGGAVAGDGYLADTWFLALDAQPTAIAATVAAASVAPGHVALTWYAADPPAGPCEVLRREGSDSWFELARLAFDGTGRLTFEDFTVQAGRRYTYALREAGETEPSALYEVEVPRGATLSLAGLTRNPSVSTLSIRFSLPDASPARLEAMDVAGRVVFRSDVGNLGAGSHVVDAGRAAPGIYWIRLTRGDRVLTARGAVVR